MATKLDATDRQQDSAARQGTATQQLNPGLVSAIIVNWNGARLLPACLAALAAQDYRPIETIVVDNGSIDGSDRLVADLPDLQLIRNASNLGFAVANNLGLRAARGEFILLLNYDVVLEPGYVSALVRSLRADPRRGSASGKLVRPADESRLRTLDSTGHVIFRNVWAMNRGEDEPDGPAYDLAGEVFGVCAAAGLYRRAMLDDVEVEGEVLAAAFFAYIEDIDLDWRARLRGWHSWYEPAAVATHYRGASGGWFSTPIQRHIFKNRLLMMVRNDGGLSWLKRAPGIVAFTGAYLLLGTLRSPKFLSAVWDVLRLAPAAWRQRRLIQVRRTVSPAELDSWFLPYPYMRKLLKGRWRRSRRQWISQS
jgi:GT2 family glycosyltransferase